MKKRVALVLVVVGLFGISISTFAHHSNAVVNKDVLIAKTGQVTRFAFVNPHVAVYWKGADGVEWYASGGTPRQLADVGWNGKTFKAGEQLLVQGHPLRDGRPIMAFRGIYRCSTGDEIQMDPGNLTEYRTRVKMHKLTADRVKALCAGAKSADGF